MLIMTSRALRFGTVAAAYERFRPGYPDELIDHVLDYTRGPVATALEIGAGTGKATRAFAQRGIAITASEPDPEMLTELRHHVPDTVTAVEATFEDLDVTGPFDLIFAAAALHWTAQESRWPRIAGLLRSSGTVANFGGPMKITDPDVRQAVDQARSSIVPSDDVGPPGQHEPDGGLQWPGSEMAASPDFTDVEEWVLERRRTVPAADYVGNLSTVSAYLELSPTDRATVLERILHALPDQVELTMDLTVHLARRV